MIRRLKSALARRESLGAALIKGIAGTAGIKMAHAAIAVLSAAILARALGPAGFGVFTYAVALVAFFAIPSELGIPNLAVREIAVTNAKKDWGYMRGFIRWSHTTIAVMSVVLVGTGAIALWLYGDRFAPDKLTCMYLGLLLIPIVSLGSLRDSMLRGLRKVLLGQLPQQIIRPLLLLLMVAILYLVGRMPDSPVIVMMLHIISVAIAFGFGLAFFLRTRPPALSTAEPHFKGGAWLRSSIPFGLTAAIQLINGRTDILALGFFRTDAEIGLYRVSVQLAAVVIFALQAINSIQGPHIAHLYASGDKKRLQEMVTRSSQAALLFALPVVVVIVLFGQIIIRLIFGEAYESAYAPLVILCIGQLINASMGSVVSLLNMTGHERDTTKSVLIGAAVNLTLNLLLVPNFGIVGAAVATTATLIVWNVIMWRKVRLRIGIEPSPLFRPGR